MLRAGRIPCKASSSLFGEAADLITTQLLKPNGTEGGANFHSGKHRIATRSSHVMQTCESMRDDACQNLRLFDTSSM